MHCKVMIGLISLDDIRLMKLGIAHYMLKHFLKQVPRSHCNTILLTSFKHIVMDTQNMYFVFLFSLFRIFFFIFQPGFAFLEAGSVRSKNVTSVLIRNYSELCFGKFILPYTKWCSFPTSSGLYCPTPSSAVALHQVVILSLIKG